MIIACLSIFWATLVVASRTQVKQAENQKQSGTIIQNKNVNIIVNVDAQKVAEELWKIIETHLNNDTDLTSSKSIQKDLEDAIIPLVSSSRRDSSPSIFQVANQLDNITRKALTKNKSDINMLDEEIMARDIVADMMATLKMILSKETPSQLNTNNKDSFNKRMMHRPINNTMTTIPNDNKRNNT